MQPEGAGASLSVFRGTSLIRDSPPPGPYSRPMPGALWWSYEGRWFLRNEVPLYNVFVGPLSPTLSLGKGSQRTRVIDLKTKYRGTSLIRNCSPPYDHPGTLGIGLRNGPRGVHFLSQVPL